MKKWFDASPAYSILGEESRIAFTATRYTFRVHNTLVGESLTRI